MTSKSTQTSQARRAILRGSLAAPLVLTVASPSAHAASSLGRCLTNLNGTQGPAFVDGTVSAPEDGWLRQRVAIKDLAAGANPGLYYLDPGLNVYVSITNTANQVNLTDAGTYTITDGGYRWVLRWVDSNGNLYGTLTAVQPSSYNACTASCYASFNPTPA